MSDWREPELQGSQTIEADIWLNAESVMQWKGYIDLTWHKIERNVSSFGF